MTAVATLRAALESERNGLQLIDADIKRIVQAPVPRHDHHDRCAASDMGRGRAAPEELSKRPHDTKTAFSRLSRSMPDSDGEDTAFTKKPRLSSHVTKDLPSKQEIMRVQCGDEESKVRNRRMFGSLLGTLQRFKRDEVGLRTREEKKAQVERRIEQQALHEREQHKRDRQRLFAERELRKARIKALEAKLTRANEFDIWAAAQRPLAGFLRTRALPPIYWLPRLVDARTRKLLDRTAQSHAEMMQTKLKELEEEQKRIEDKCLRSVKTLQATHETKENEEIEETEGGAPEADKGTGRGLHSPHEHTEDETEADKTLISNSIKLEKEPERERDVNAA